MFQLTAVSEAMLARRTSHGTRSQVQRQWVECAVSLSPSLVTERAVPDVLIQITVTQGLVMGRWCGLGLLAHSLASWASQQDVSHCSPLWHKAMAAG